MKHLRGVVVERSPLPDPKSNQYADCLFAVTFELETELETERVAVAMWGFTNRIPCEAASIQVGQVVELDLLPFEAAPPSVRRAQISDTLSDIGLPLYFAATPLLTDVFRDVSLAADPAAEPNGSTSRSSERQQPAIRADIASIEAQLVAAGGDWDAWRKQTMAELAPVLEAFNKEEKLVGTNAAGRVELLTTVELQRNWERELPQSLEFVEFLHVMQRSFQKLGADLIVVPFPDRTEVTASHFAGKPLPNTERLRLHLDLLKEGFEVIDLFPPLVAAIGEGRGPVHYYGTVDDHPARAGLQVAASELAKRLARYDLTKTQQVLRYAEVAYTNVYDATVDPVPTFPARRILADGKVLESPAQAEVLVFGDSFVQVPETFGVEGANIAAQLMLETRVPVSYFTKPGGRAWILHHLARMPSAFTANRKVVIFLFHVDTVFWEKTWTATDFIAAQRRVEADVHTFHNEGVAVARFSRDAAWATWTCEPSEGAFPLKNRLGLPAFDAARVLTMPQPVPPGEYLLFLRMYAGLPTSLRYTGIDLEDPVLLVDQGLTYEMRRFTVVDEAVRLGFELAPQASWLNLDFLELRRLPSE